MSLHACVNQVMNDSDEDDEAPIRFIRKPNSSSKLGHLSSASKKIDPQKDGSANIAARQVAHNGENSNLQNSKLISNTKALSGKQTTTASSNSRSSVSVQSKHTAQYKFAINDMQRKHEDESAPGNLDSDDSDDNKPLNQRTTSASATIEKRSSINSEKKLQSSVSKFVNKSTDKLNLGKTTVKSENSDDCDDNKPLSFRFSPSGAVNCTASSHILQEPQSEHPTVPPLTKMKLKSKEQSDDSEDEKPILARMQLKKVKDESDDSEDEKMVLSKMQLKKNREVSDDSEDEKPILDRIQSKTTGSSVKNSNGSEKLLSSNLKLNGPERKKIDCEISAAKGGKKRALSDTSTPDTALNKKARVSETSVSKKVGHQIVTKKEMKGGDSDQLAISQRMKKSVPSSSTSISKKLHKTSSSIKKNSKKLEDSKFSKSMKVPPGSGGDQKWTTLEHNGVIFPPPYKPHGIKMLYNGQLVDLTPEQEEVATMFAVMKDTEYATKKQFIENFMNDWRQILGKNHIIKKFELCDFTPIYEWHQREKEKKKQMSAEEKKAVKEEKLKQEEKFMWAIVDGVKEKVGNFRVEPPGLFRGRGEHPKMGKLKKRIRPSDITINIGKDASVPQCPVPGERWKEVKHDNTVTWLAFWNDPINPKEFKYVFLAASSSLKGQSDKEKYEKARLLKDYIHNIRANYTKDFTSKDPTKRQIAVATYLIDKLALRAGNEKDDDEADTVGCCTLKVENVELVPPNKLKFDFLGKDSIRYLNTVEVEVPVYKAIGGFQTAKKSDGSKKGKGDDLFDLLDTSKLNAHLKELMPGLTAKVFRTYNASITLDVILNRETKDGTVPEKVAVYQHANKEVAIICNHQRSVSKSHESQMSRLNEKINDLEAQREEFKIDLSRARKGKPPLKDKEGKPKRNLSPEAIEKKIAQLDAKIEKMELDKKIKEDLKTVALGTSKINYLDPRISVAWCKRHEVPIEKIFNKSLLAKFAWAMDVDPSFRF